MNKISKHFFNYITIENKDYFMLFVNITYPIPIYFGWIRKIKQLPTTPWENSGAIILVTIHKITAADSVTLHH